MPTRKPGNVSGNGGGNTLLRGKGEVIHAGDSVERGDGLHAQRVDLSLDQHFADRLYRLL